MAMDRKRYTPSSNAKPSTGNTPIAVTVAAKTAKLQLKIAAAPFGGHLHEDAGAYGADTGKNSYTLN